MSDSVAVEHCSSSVVADTASDARPIYLDYHATTPVDKRVADVVVRYMTTMFGNASSADHVLGDEADAAVNDARRQVASLVGAEPRDIVFTSGATESINLALKGVAASFMSRRRMLRVAYMPVEHRAVLDTLTALAAGGAAELHPLRVDRGGRLDMDDLTEACRAGVDLVCVMAANNEIGTLYPLQAVAELAHAHGALMFSDATQAVGKIPLASATWGIDLLACTAHKLYGPKGVGALVIGPSATIEPLIHGGGHQRGLRSGTLNVPGIAGFGEACRLRELEMSTDEPRVAALRNRMEAILCARIAGLVVNSAPEARLAGNLHISIPDVPNTVVLGRIRDRVAIATGAACSSGIEGPSHVLRAIHLPQALQDGALRIGVGKFTTGNEVEAAAQLIAAAVLDARVTLSDLPRRFSHSGRQANTHSAGQ